MKKFTVLFFFLSCCAYTSNAQLTKQNICAQLKEEKSVLFDNEVFVAGEVSKPQIIKSLKFPLTLSQSIAMVGGFSKKASVEEIQIVKCASDFGQVASLTLVNFRDLIKGNEKDLEINGGEIIYIPKIKGNILYFDLIK